MKAKLANGQCTTFSGIAAEFSTKAAYLPIHSECGVGALMPWAGKLWFVTYVSNPLLGAGTGLYTIGDDLVMHRHPESIAGTYANRMVHGPSCQLVIGPHLVDLEGRVRTVRDIQTHRLAATMEHLESPGTHVYFLTMEGLLFETDVRSLKSKQLCDLNREMEFPDDVEPHFKDGYTSASKLIVANNTYDERDFLGLQAHGRLAAWDGTRWEIIERKPFNEVTGRKTFGEVIYAVGWDRASALLTVGVRDTWSTYRLPKASQTFDHLWQTEWTRIREVEHERYLMDCHGMFYEMSPVAYAGKVWGVRPISTHLRVVPDFCSWKGYLVLGGNNNTPFMDPASKRDHNLYAGEAQTNLWIGKLDDLWGFGKPKGWGGPWHHDPVEEGQCSDPFLMTGFDQKVLHLHHDGAKPVEFELQVDFLGTQEWQPYTTVEVPPRGYGYHVFPPGFSVHWARIRAGGRCAATACFVYT